MLRDSHGAYPVIQFNIIYIMRTLVVICGFCRPGLIHGLSPAANHAGAGYSCR